MRVSISGNVTRDAKLGNPGEEQRQYVRFRIASASLTPPGADDGFIDVVMFGKQAANVADRAKTGARAFIQGRLVQKRGQNGQLVTGERVVEGYDKPFLVPEYEIVADPVFGCDIASSSRSSAPAENGTASDAAPAEEEVPF